MKIPVEATLSTAVTILGAAFGFFGNLYLLKVLPASDYLLYGFAISIGGIFVEGLYLWQKNAIVAVSGCGADALNNIAGTRPIMMTVSLLAFIAAVLAAFHAEGNAVLSIAIGLAVVSEGVLNIQMGLFRAAGQAATSYMTNLVSTIVRWCPLLILVVQVGFVKAFILTLPLRIGIVVWAYVRLLPSNDISTAEKQEQRRTFWNFAKSFVFFAVCYAFINHSDRIFFSTFSPLSAADAKDFLFFSIFGSAVVGLFCTSLLTVFYPRLVSAKQKAAQFQSVLRTSVTTIIVVGSAALALLYISMPLLQSTGVIAVGLNNMQSLLWFCIAQIFLSASTMAQMPSILFSRGQWHAAWIYFGCTSLYLASGALAMWSGHYQAIPAVKAFSMFMMFSLLLIHAFYIMRLEVTGIRK